MTDCKHDWRHIDNFESECKKCGLHKNQINIRPSDQIRERAEELRKQFPDFIESCWQKAILEYLDHQAGFPLPNE